VLPVLPAVDIDINPQPSASFSDLGTDTFILLVFVFAGTNGVAASSFV
jgi:hypothetical protein